MRDLSHEEIAALDKPALRRWAIARRAALDMTTLSSALIQSLRDLPAFQKAQHILLYRAMRDEVNVNPLMDNADVLEADSDPNAKQWYLPRCVPNRRLAIHRYGLGDTLRHSAFGVLEPDPTTTVEIDPSLLDLVVVPALLLTPNGDRLGYGGGYYDRFLPNLSPECISVGALPDALVVRTLPRDGWDILLDIVVQVPSKERIE